MWADIQQQKSQISKHNVLNATNEKKMSTVKMN